MALQTETALAALKTALTGLENLPTECRRNDLSFQEFDASGTPGVSFKLMLSDEEIGVTDTQMGEPLVFDLGVGAEIIFAVEGQPGDERDAVFLAGVEALALALWPPGDDSIRRPLAVPGAFDDLRTAGPVGRQHIMGESGVLPVEAIRVPLSLITSAPSPLG